MILEEFVPAAVMWIVAIVVSVLVGRVRDRRGVLWLKWTLAWLLIGFPVYTIFRWMEVPLSDGEFVGWVYVFPWVVVILVPLVMWGLEWRSQARERRGE